MMFNTQLYIHMYVDVVFTDPSSIKQPIAPGSYKSIIIVDKILTGLNQAYKQLSDDYTENKLL